MTSNFATETLSRVEEVFLAASETGARLERALAQVHGLTSNIGRDLARHGGSMNVKEAEVYAMFEAMLGPSYPEEKIRAVLSAQTAFDVTHQKLCHDYDAGQLTAEQFVRSVNSAIRATFDACERVLGERDFIAFFGAPPEDATGYIDLETFLESERD